ncbi:FmdB family zinc ribbon protein [Desulfosarcina ovata]|uniref:FmdB family transcriptional regulator n=2 Tax=Desulfosarcina ovata TaxID=83564 RepID=A0A5K8A8X9_9BACT|nr:FmdB family zinc ribbon protein [Desulfosarcina ovata]BBO81684.1 FmdB family transcriptional regulator [Desulfosarcina ovata subsp. sediminis]BBO88919.1 FmdB family transcriptional regulator [Desulfosarcina ovata subsp. ovata]
MPLYEYQCTACGKIEEAIQKFSDAPLTTCKHCSGKLNKLISQSSFHLKGTGWYVTDYSKKSSPENGKSAAPSETKNEKSTSGDTKATPAQSDK